MSGDMLALGLEQKSLRDERLIERIAKFLWECLDVEIRHISNDDEKLHLTTDALILFISKILYTYDDPKKYPVRISTLNAKVSKLMSELHNR